MSLSNPVETVSPQAIDCRGKARLCLGFHVETEILTSPSDMVLVLDRSGSMCGQPIQEMKLAARCLIRQVAQASGDPRGESLLGGSTMGLVSFASDAVTEAALTENTEPLNRAISGLRAGGDTNHQKAFELGGALLGRGENQRKILILFTDGVSNLGNPDPAARALKAAGIEIYCIGLLRSPCLLKPWASCPWETHTAVTADPGKLQQVFGEIASEIVRSGVEDGVIRGRLTEDFQIRHLDQPSHGTAEVTGPRSFLWQIGHVNTSGDVSLCMEIIHVGPQGGRKAVHDSMIYRDRQGSCLEFESPEITAVCSGGSVCLEPCPEPRDVTAGCCQEVVTGEAGSVCLSGLGRIVEVNAVIRNVCPGKRLAAAVILTERDRQGHEYPRGTKVFEIPPQKGEGCRDVTLHCIRFAVPESIRPDGICPGLCSQRHFEVRVLANYVDTDFVCCDSETELLS